VLVCRTLVIGFESSTGEVRWHPFSIAFVFQ
jgi:hypothetical protein